MAKASTLLVVVRSPTPEAEAFQAWDEPNAAANVAPSATTGPAVPSPVPSTKDPPYIRRFMVVMGLIGSVGLIIWMVLSSRSSEADDSEHHIIPDSALLSATKALRNGWKPVRGVNLAGWLVAEHAITWDSPLWEGVPIEVAQQGEYKTMEFLGHEVGDARFQKHRETWITEQDIGEIARNGLNLVRVPVGFWIVGNDDTDTGNRQQWKMYAPGALAFLDKLINEWAPRYTVTVMISLHAHKGSQNGEASSAPLNRGEHNWHLYPENVENSVHFARFLANRYRNSEGFVGLSLMNEPTTPTNATKLQEYYTNAYEVIRWSGIECVLGVSPLLSEQNGTSMQQFMSYPQYHKVWLEWHPRFDQDNSKSESMVLEDVANYDANLRSWRGDWVFISEWSLSSPSSAPFNDSSPVDGCAGRKRLGAALKTAYQSAHSGWTFSSWRHADESTTNRSELSMRQNLRDGCLDIGSNGWS